MDIPIELFLGFIGTSIALAIFGFVRNPQIPASLVIGGMFILTLAVATDNIVLGFSTITDSSQISENTIGNSTTYHMVFEASNTNGTMYNSAGGNFARGELVSTASSVLNGKYLQCVDLQLQKVGSPTGTLVVNAYIVSTTNIVKQIGFIGFSSISTSLDWYVFCLPEGQEVLMETGMIIGAHITGGTSNATNYIIWKYQSTGGFDGSNTRAELVAFGATTWTTVGVVNADMTMRIYDYVPIVVITEDLFQSSEPNIFEFTELPKVLFGLIGAIFMLVGGLMVMKD